MNWELFLQTLPIIGSCLVGIFGTIGVMIAIVFLLNKATAVLENRGKSDEN